MGLFQKSTGYVPQLRQEVNVGGSRTNLIECVDFNAKTASFKAPTLWWDSRREQLRDGRV